MNPLTKGQQQVIVDQVAAISSCSSSAKEATVCNSHQSVIYKNKNNLFKLHFFLFIKESWIFFFTKEKCTAYNFISFSTQQWHSYVIYKTTYLSPLQLNFYSDSCLQLETSKYQRGQPHTQLHLGQLQVHLH